MTKVNLDGPYTKGRIDEIKRDLLVEGDPEAVLKLAMEDGSTEVLSMRYNVFHVLGEDNYITVVSRNSLEEAGRGNLGPLHAEFDIVPTIPLTDIKGISLVERKK